MGLVPDKRGSREMPVLLHRVRTQGEGAGREPERGPSPEGDHAGTVVLDYPASRTMRNRFLCLISDSVCGILLKQADCTKTMVLWFCFVF